MREQNLRVMDPTAIAQCMEHDMPILVFNFRKEGNIETGRQWRTYWHADLAARAWPVQQLMRIEHYELPTKSLLDAEERMEKAIRRAQARPGGHPHRPGQSWPGRFAAGGSLRLADADQGNRHRSARRADANRHSPVRSRHDQGHRKGDSGQRPGL